MKTWKLELLAAAMSLAMATTAGAQSTNSKTMPAEATTPPGSTMRSDIPKECVNLTGRAMSDCVRDHNPSSVRSKSGTNGSTGMGNADSDAGRGTRGAMRNDKSGSGTGSTGTSAGTSGQAGAAGAGSSAAGGAAGDTGSAGAGGGGGK
jgi:hypothetical protein